MFITELGDCTKQNIVTKPALLVKDLANVSPKALILFHQCSFKKTHQETGHKQTMTMSEWVGRSWGGVGGGGSKSGGRRGGRIEEEGGVGGGGWEVNMQDWRTSG